jgi:chromosome segregation ATPase
VHRELADERVTIARLTDALEHERQGREVVAHRAVAAEMRLETMLHEIAQMRTAQHDWHARHAARTQQLDDAVAALEALGTERDALRRDLDAAQRELESARADLRIVDHDRGALAARAQAVDAAATALREQLARRAEAEAALVAERDRIARNAMAQADRITALERDLARRQTEIDALHSRHEGLAGLVALLEGTWLGRRALAAVRDTGR